MFKQQNVNTFNATIGQLAVSPTGKREHSPQPRSPCLGQADHSQHTASTAQSSMPSYSTSTSILISRTSLSPQNQFPARSANAANSSPVYVNANDLFEKTVATLLEAGCTILPSQLADLFDGRGDLSTTRQTTDAINRFVDDLSGSDARRALASILHAVAQCNAIPKPPALCAIATATFVDDSSSKTPRRNSSQGSITSRLDTLSPKENNRTAHSALMRPSFACEVDPEAHSGSYVPPMSPFNFSAQNVPMTAHPSDAASLHFKTKNRRESVESYSSTYVASKVRSVRSIERSVDADGYKVINDYTVLQALGKGTSGKVKQVVHHDSGECRAIKIVKRSMVKKLQGPHGIDRLRKEVAIMKKLNHKNVIQLFEVIDDPDSDKMYFVMQYVAKGEVLPGIDEIQQLAETCGDNNSPNTGTVKCKPLPEERVAKYIRQAATGLIYLHNHGIVHFDIKPQNILCDHDDNVVIADFGVSELMRSATDNTVESAGLGTPAFMAPEVCRGDRLVDGEAVDVWSLGVTTFAMLYAKMPFRGRSVRDLHLNIQKLVVVFPPETTAVQRDFFDHIFVDAKDRWNLRQLRKHPFLATSAGANLMGSVRLDHSTRPPGDDDNLANSTHHGAFLHRGAFAVTQVEMEAAISRLVSPVFGEMGEVISSCSSESRSGSLSQDSYSRVQSPRLGPNPPAAPAGNFSASEVALPNPRGAMARGVLAEKETISPPLSRYSSISFGSALDDAARARRETQVMREASVGR